MILFLIYKTPDVNHTSTNLFKNLMYEAIVSRTWWIHESRDRCHPGLNGHHAEEAAYVLNKTMYFLVRELWTSTNLLSPQKGLHHYNINDDITAICNVLRTAAHRREPHADSPTGTSSRTTKLFMSTWGTYTTTRSTMTSQPFITPCKRLLTHQNIITDLPTGM